MSTKHSETVQEKTYEFALLIVSTYQILVNEKKEFVLSKQLVRSGTSIGANAEEAYGGISRKDFKFKLSISYKEARESKYWIRLLHDTGYLNQDQFQKLFEAVEELLKILYTILKNSR